MFIYLVVTLLCFKSSVGETELAFEESLKQYLPIYQSRTFLNYSHCNLFYRSDSDVSRNLANWFASKNNCANIIISKTFEIDYRVTESHGDFHFFESVQEVKSNLLNLPETIIFEEKGQAHFIIGTKVLNLKFLLPTFKFLWNKHFVDCVIVFVYKRREVEVFSYDAFRNVVHNLTSCGMCPIFSKIVKNFWGYPMRVNMFQELPLMRKVNGQYVGRDYDILTEIARRSNVTLQILETDKGFMGAGKSMIHNESDMCFVSIFLVPKLKVKGIDYTFPGHFNSIVLLIPNAPRMPQYKTLMYIFDNYVWINLLMTILGFTLLIKILATFDNRHNTFFFYFLDVWRSFLQQSLWNLSRRYYKIKFIMGLWFAFNLIFGTAFNTSLMSMLVSSKYWKDVNTIEEVRKWGLSFYVPGMYADMIPREYGLHSKFKIVKTMNHLHDLIYTSNKFSGYIMNEEAARVYVEIVKDRSNRPHYHIVDEKLVPGIDTFMIQKKSPFLNRVNYMLMLIRQFGLRDHWIRSPPIINEGSKKIKIGNLQGAFYLLILGYIISVVCFVGELSLQIVKKLLFPRYFSR